MEESLKKTHSKNLQQALMQFLKTTQQKSGVFEAAVSGTQDFKVSTPVLTTFYTSLVTRCVAQSRTTGNNHEQDEIIKKAGDYLLSQKSQYWTWNYLDKQQGQSPYPDDLDDTFLAASALQHTRPDVITGEVLAALVKNLIRCETHPGGPYRTWCVGDSVEDVWRDIDVVVNANIAGFLAAHDVVVPRIDEWIEAAVFSNKKAYSPYYPNPYPLWYFVAPWYRGEKKAFIEKIIDAADEKGIWNNNPFDTALCVNALLCLGAGRAYVDNALSYMRSSKAEELCRPYICAVEQITETGTIYYSGSAAFSAAVVCEALTRYEQATQKNTQKEKSTIDEIENRLYQTIQDEIKKICKGRKQTTLNYIQAISRHPQTRTGCLLGYYAWLACGASDELKAHQSIPVSVFRYGIAALHGSVAYKIYDDFFDEQGNTDALTLAGANLRAFTTVYATAHPAIWELFLYATEVMDASQEWEEKNCKIEKRGDYFILNTIPEYGQYDVLAQKSLGLVLAPAAVLIEDGHDPESVLVQSIIDFCTHYIIARQLNDDGHDWQQDLRNGKLNSVSAALATEYLEIGMHYHTEETIEYLGKIFWNEEVKRVSNAILTHTQKAAHIITSTLGVHHPEHLVRVLAPLEQTAREAITQATTVAEFLSEYKKEEV